MGWVERIARATRPLCQAAVLSEPTLHVGYLATLREIDDFAPSAAVASDARGRDEVGTSSAPRSTVPSGRLAWR
jgi:hypothetical protein